MTLRRIHSATFRYRVGRLAHVFTDRNDQPDGAVIYDVREFRNLKHAEAYGRKLADQGDHAILQVGVLQWMPTHEAEALMRKLTTDPENTWDLE